MTTDELVVVIAKAADCFHHQARAALLAIEANGHRVVPVEPTKAMIEAVYDPGDGESSSGIGRSEARYIWAAMLAAAPKVKPTTEDQ
jgi:hypothetical protein